MDVFAEEKYGITGGRGSIGWVIIEQIQVITFLQRQ